MRLFPLILASAISLSLTATAQNMLEEKAEEPASSSDRTCRIIFPERPNKAPRLAYLFDGNKSIQVNLPSTNFSKVIVLPRGELTLVMTPTKISDPKKVPPGAPKLKIPEAVKDFYILMTPNPSNSILPVRMNLVNTSEGRLRKGQTLWFNLTDHRIVAKLGDKKMSVGPKSSTVTSDPVSDSGYYRAKLAFQPNAEGKFHKITEQHWWHDAENRHLGFIVDSGGRLPKIYYYRDFRQ